MAGALESLFVGGTVVGGTVVGAGISVEGVVVGAAPAAGLRERPDVGTAWLPELPQPATSRAARVAPARAGAVVHHREPGTTRDPRRPAPMPRRLPAIIAAPCCGLPRDSILQAPRGARGSCSGRGLKVGVASAAIAPNFDKRWSATCSAGPRPEGRVLATDRAGGTPRPGPSCRLDGWTRRSVRGDGCG